MRQVMAGMLFGAWLAASPGAAQEPAAVPVAPRTGTSVTSTAPPAEVFVETSTRRGLVFVLRDGKPLRLDLVKPISDRPVPVVVVIHGGGWASGLRHFDPIPGALARRGIAGVGLDFRLAPKHPHPAQVDDIRRAIRWLRANAEDLGVDRERIGVLGASSGGHLAALIATLDDRPDADASDPVERESARVSCCVSLIAPFDLSPDPNEIPTDLQVQLVADFLGVKTLDGEEAKRIALERARLASPVTWASPDDPPFLIVSGIKDPLIPPTQARKMAARLKVVGVGCELIEIPDGGHGEWMGNIRAPNPTTAQDYWMRTVRFLKARLSVPDGVAAPAPSIPR